MYVGLRRGHARGAIVEELLHLLQRMAHEQRALARGASASARPVGGDAMERVRATATAARHLARSAGLRRHEPRAADGDARLDLGLAAVAHGRDAARPWRHARLELLTTLAAREAHQVQRRRRRRRCSGRRRAAPPPPGGAGFAEEDAPTAAPGGGGGGGGAAVGRLGEGAACAAAFAFLAASCARAASGSSSRWMYEAGVLEALASLWVWRPCSGQRCISEAQPHRTTEK